MPHRCQHCVHHNNARRPTLGRHCVGALDCAVSTAAAPGKWSPPAQMMFAISASDSHPRPAYGVLHLLEPERLRTAGASPSAAGRKGTRGPSRPGRRAGLCFAVPRDDDKPRKVTYRKGPLRSVAPLAAEQRCDQGTICQSTLSFGPAAPPASRCCAFASGSGARSQINPQRPALNPPVLTSPGARPEHCGVTLLHGRYQSAEQGARAHSYLLGCSRCL